MLSLVLGDGSEDSIQYPIHIYADSGHYIICLTITDSLECSNSHCDSSFKDSSIISVNVVPPNVAGTQLYSKPIPFNIFPNPSQGIITIQSSYIQSNDLGVELYNVLGEKINSQVIPAPDIKGGYQLHIDAANGLYLLVIRNGDSVESKRISLEK